jgi:predicted nucleic acid-binding protein
MLEAADEPLIIPSPTLVEVDYFVRDRMAARVMLVLLDDIRRGAYVIEHVQDTDLRRISEIMDRYDDARVCFVDAAVLAIVERLREPKLATLDRRHFRDILRPNHVESLRLLPE